MMGFGWGYCPGLGGFGGYGGFGGRFGLVGMGLRFLLFFGLIVLGIYLFRHFFKHNPIAPENNALGILRERYAKGEIDTEEFQRRKEELK